MIGIGKIRVILVILLALAGAGLSGLLWLQHHGEGSATELTAQICGDDPAQEGGCESVNTSQYSEVAGVPLAALGLFFYLSVGLLLLLAVLSTAPALAAAGRVAAIFYGVALLIDLVLLALQAFAIGAFCKLCLATYAINAVSLLLLYPALRVKEAVSGTLRMAEGRLVVTGWVLGSVALAAAVASSEVSLQYRQAKRSVSILGLPTGGLQPPAALPELQAPAAQPTAAAAAPPAQAAGAASQELAQVQEQLRAAQAQAQAAQARADQLQRTIDDPKELENYYAQKAMNEFEAAARESIDLQGVPVLGPPEAPIQVVEFSDYLCPYCKQVAQAFDNFLPQAGGRVAVYFKNYPLDMSCNTQLQRDLHPGACLLALGSICAQEQGKFEPYYHKVFAAPPQKVDQAVVLELGAGAGLDRAALEACLQADTTKQRLEAEIAEARRLGVSGTPSLFVNGKKLPSLNYFVQVVEKELQRLNLPPLQQGQPAAPH